MNNKFEIKYTELFYQDLMTILNYIKYELGNIQAANNLFDRIIEEVSSRACNPESYERYRSLNGNIYYRIYVKNYTIFYVVQDKIVEVRRILYGRRDINKFIWIAQSNNAFVIYFVLCNIYILVLKIAMIKNYFYSFFIILVIYAKSMYNSKY